LAAAANITVTAGSSDAERVSTSDDSDLIGATSMAT
jgi:hypothetical protein